MERIKRLIMVTPLSTGGGWPHHLRLQCQPCRRRCAQPQLHKYQCRCNHIGLCFMTFL